MHDDEQQAAARKQAVNALVGSLQELTPDSIICTTAVIWQTEDCVIRVATQTHPDMAYERDGVEMSNVAHLAELLEEAAKKLRSTLG